MKSLDSIILCALLAVFHLKESISMNSQPPTTEEPEKMYADPLYSPLHKSYQFIAYLVKGNKIFNTKKCKFLGSASIVTDRHALTAASTISKYAGKKYKNIYIIIGGDQSFCMATKLLQSIEYVKPHRQYVHSEVAPFADISVIVLQREIDFTKTNAATIPLRLQDVEDSIVVNQMGWSSKGDGKCANNECCFGTVRKFQIAIITNNRHLFTSVQGYIAEKADHGAPIYISTTDGLELIGITSKPSTLRPSIHVKIYNFLPFIAHELSNDPLNENRATVYKPEKWVLQLLKSKFLGLPPDKILN